MDITMGQPWLWPLGHVHGQRHAPHWQIGDLALGHALHGAAEVALYVARVHGEHVAKVLVMFRRSKARELDQVRGGLRRRQQPWQLRVELHALI